MMLINEILVSTHKILFEYGRKSFPGFGASLFGQRYYEYMVVSINLVADPHAREWLTDWLSEAFLRDNPRFKPDLFKRSVAARKRYSASPVFQQRHFYYLAYLVKQISDPHIREFVQDWLAEVAGGTNPKFKRDVWDKFCAVDEPSPKKEPILNNDPNQTDRDEWVGSVARGQEVDEGYGGAPGFGIQGHGGFGKKFFRRSHWQYIAYYLHLIPDPVVCEHLTKWFVDVFKLDNPGFNPEHFKQAVMSSGTDRHYPPSVIFQSRHFYYLAHEVAEIGDAHEREFVCDWLGDVLDRTNDYFRKDRWRKYCNLSDNDDHRRYVRHHRAKARGDKEIPETPWQERKRLEREKATILTPEEFHAHATCYAEFEGKLTGHDLVYMRLPNGEYEVYDKTTGKDHWAVEGANLWADERDELPESVSKGTFRLSVKKDPSQKVATWGFRVYDRHARVISSRTGFDSEAEAYAAGQKQIEKEKQLEPVDEAYGSSDTYFEYKFGNMKLIVKREPIINVISWGFSLYGDKARVLACRSGYDSKQKAYEAGLKAVAEEQPNERQGTSTGNTAKADPRLNDPRYQAYRSGVDFRHLYRK